MDDGGVISSQGEGRVKIEDAFRVIFLSGPPGLGSEGGARREGPAGAASPGETALVEEE